MKVTIYDVAKRAGVSTATVSKVINNRGKISAKTKAKVLKVMEELNFEPSMFAAALTVKRSYTIGLLLPNLANPFFAEIARKIEDRAHERGYNIFMCNTDNNEEKEAKYVSLLRRHSVDGIIVASAFSNLTVLDQLFNDNIPVAVVSQDIPALSLNTVTVNDFKGGYQATNYLLSLNHTNIAVIAEDLRSSSDRIKGFEVAHEDAGVPFNKEFIRHGFSSVEGAMEETRKLLKSDQHPTAIFACNDLLAMGVMQVAQEYNIQIPQELSIIGFDNTVLALSSVPALTTMAQPFDEMGKQVVDLLVQEIQGEITTKQTYMLVPELIIRNTTAKPSIVNV
ncbi:LacI family DNA-binding transcriptional regulator [Shouchella shacheensis]|uniref:LacI family DNA-binding transcriptional regulator n=1 Tax=Shouchella shacheensis TaxID=1649580 RepID=UPI00074026A1|nr:LacI family DNA-binding transcriptional regulator [Shouchella shacheensis]